MTDDSLSNSDRYIMRLTEYEYRDHKELIYIGSTMAQLLTENKFLNAFGETPNYQSALREIAAFFDKAPAYAENWKQVLSQLKDAYDIIAEKK